MGGDQQYLQHYDFYFQTAQKFERNVTAQMFHVYSSWWDNKEKICLIDILSMH